MTPICVPLQLFYRYLQYFSENKSSINLKKITLKLIYCSMRINIGLEDDMSLAGSSTHPHTAARIWDFCGKLAMLNDTGVPDPNCVQVATHLHLKILAEVVDELEFAYLKSSRKNNDSPLSIIRHFAQENSGLKYTLGRHERWDEIQALINRFASMSRVLIDNESSIIFMGETFSLPR